MIKANVKSLRLFEQFLAVASKFVQQGQLVITKEKSSLFCKNTQDFSTSRLLLDTNTLLLDSTAKNDSITVCIRDINALKSSINIIQTVEMVDTCTLELEDIPDINNEDGITAKTIQYHGKAKFKLITVDYQIVEKYVSKELNVQLSRDWEFYINPINLDILQNRTSSIVNLTDDVSIYIYPDSTTGRVIVDLSSRQTNYMNSLALPIAETYTGKLDNKMSEVAVHESAFRLFNILKCTGEKSLDCFFNNSYNVFFITSEITDGEFYIKSRILSQIIKGK